MQHYPNKKRMQSTFLYECTNFALNHVHWHYSIMLCAGIKIQTGVVSLELELVVESILPFLC